MPVKSEPMDASPVKKEISSPKKESPMKVKREVEEDSEDDMPLVSGSLNFQLFSTGIKHFHFAEIHFKVSEFWNFLTFGPTTGLIILIFKWILVFGTTFVYEVKHFKTNVSQ